ncbi:hypothetical protein ACFL13_02660 [Patescibacteria group bacterium]
MPLETIAESYSHDIWENNSPYTEFETGGECSVSAPMVQEEVDNFKSTVTQEALDELYRAYEFRDTTTEHEVIERSIAQKERKETALRFLTGEERTLITAKAAQEELDILTERALNYLHQESVGYASMFAVGVFRESSLVNSWIIDAEKAS